jgi:hypothetical protein
LAEVGDEVRLVVIARVYGDARPVFRVGRAPHGALKANGASEFLRTDADVLGEGATKMTTRDTKPLRDMFYASFSCFEQTKRTAGELGRCGFERVVGAAGDCL